MAQFDRDDTLKKVVDIVSHKLKKPGSSISESSRFQELGADSLDMVEMVMKFEEVFGIEIEDAAADQFADVRGVVDYITSKRAR
jgi:acyl carrier protein